MPSIGSPIRLNEIIKIRIEDEGPISFRDFMEMALYYPVLGYYTSPEKRIGKAGDFYTSPCLSPVFGAMIGKQLEEMYQILGEEKFTIVECGGGTGLLSEDILAFLENNPELYEKLDYYIIEKSPEKLKRLHKKIKCYASTRELPPIRGCILSNELIDNLPVHQVVMQEELMEVFVNYKGGFVECLQPATTELKNYLAELKVELPKGFRTEINLDAIAWLKEISNILERGYLLTIDYGYPSSELYHSCRCQGTLLCYHKHCINHNPYEAVGEQDITAHVNFSALCLWGSRNGLEYCGYREQGPFLLALGFKDQMKKYRQEQNDPLKYEKEAFISHMLIEDMGSKFKVLIQQKETRKKELLGLRALY